MRRRSGARGAGLFALFLALACASPAPSPRGSGEPTPAKAAAPKRDRLAEAERAFRASEYAAAEAAFKEVLGLGPASADDASGRRRRDAMLGLARVEHMTGRYAQAARRAASVRGSLEAAVIQAEALRSQGLPEEAARRLEVELERLKGAGRTPEASAGAAPDAEPADRASRLDVEVLLGDVNLELGREEEAERALMGVIEAYNEDRIGARDAESLALVGRAAHLLRSARDANDAFNEAETAAEPSLRTLLWRAELFLEKHDAGHAEEVLKEALVRAPDHPHALVLMAEVKLAQALDFAAADRLAEQALGVNPKFARAYFVLAGTRLRDMELEQASEQIEKGLQQNPRDLELLSLRATERFLADDRLGYARAIERVLSFNPRFARVYEIVGTYAEWEHRYDEIVEMMRRAVDLDRGNAVARAELGLNLLRAGAEREGVSELEQAFADDPFNVRVFNTLNLYQAVIPSAYESVRHGRFLVRYPKAERAILERYVPQLLDRAFDSMKKRYGFVPNEPIGIELYAKREHFAVRTSGLPQTAIQGVCFGKTLAAMSLGEERFNLGMTLWHELGHVFHIQLSKSHVPRWFTEGLAEWETLSTRPEWKREQDLELYDAVRRGRIPHLGSMNRAFTRAESLNDMATAYYASTEVISWIAERHGFEALVKMLALFGQGKRTPEVLETALGAPLAELDVAFRAWLDQRLERYRRQFVPPLDAPPLSNAKAAAQSNPKDAQAQRQLAQSFLEAKRLKAAMGALERALALEPQHPEARFLAARLEMAASRPLKAVALLLRLTKDGHDGYLVRSLLGQAFSAVMQPVQAQDAWRRAAELDPSQSAPHEALLRLARESGDKAGELAALEGLAALEEHNGAVYRRLLTHRIAARDFGNVDELAEAALYADMEGLRTHLLLAEAFEARGDKKRALYELESAVECPAPPEELREAFGRLAAGYEKRGLGAKARKARERAAALGPESSKTGPEAGQ